jgi:curved DNA-binding protein CbpA
VAADAIGAGDRYSVTMARPLDPWRTLELPRDATLEDVKAAYRRLAKRYHPDSAGEAALARFLAVQAAYEALTEGPARLRLGLGGRTPRPAAPRQAAQRQTRPTGGPAARPTGGPARGPGGGARPGSWTDAGAGSRTGSTGRAGTRGPTGGTGRRGATRKRAKPGSTSYDDAQFEPFEPSWEGASWYGESSGTYWTLNPKEFADPRKHGPEYQARARSARAGRGRPPDAPPQSESASDEESWTAREPAEGDMPPSTPDDVWSSAGPGPAVGWAARGWSAPDRTKPGWSEPGWSEPGWSEPGWSEPGWAAPGRARPGAASGLGPTPSHGGLAADGRWASTSAAELVSMGLLGLGIATLVFAVLGFAILGGPVVDGLEPTVAAGGIASIVLGAIVRNLASRPSTR